MPLFTDPYAQRFIDAAMARGWQLPPSHMVERIRAISNYAASRTKWFDNFFVAAGANGIVQAVILAAGLDARAWRLPWVERQRGVRDRPAEGARVQGRDAASTTQPAARYVAVPIDLRQDWPKALRDAGFDPQEPTAWAAEGLLPYLPAEGQDLLFERIQRTQRTRQPGRVSNHSATDSSTRTIWRAGASSCVEMREAAGDDAEPMPLTSRTSGSSRTAPMSPSG